MKIAVCPAGNLVIALRGCVDSQRADPVSPEAFSAECGSHQKWHAGNYPPIGCRVLPDNFNVIRHVPR